MNMPSFRSSHRRELRERLAETLAQQDATPAEIAEWTPVVQHLGEWPEHVPTIADTRRLLAALASLVPQRSPVRLAVRERFARRGSFAWLLDIGRAQVSILRPSFWLLSAAVALLGVFVELASWDTDAVLWVRALGPLLAYLGITAIFRGVRLRMLECEIGCPPSPLQLALARLVIVLGYDVALGFCLGVALWLRGAPEVPGGASFLAVTLHWLTPLLLVAGLALVLSLRLPVGLAATIAYAGWLSALGLYYSIATSLADGAARVGPSTPPTIPIGVESALALAGLLMLTVGAWRLPTSISRLLPTV
jgi:hypothetical protein